MEHGTVQGLPRDAQEVPEEEEDENTKVHLGVITADEIECGDTALLPLTTGRSRGGKLLCKHQHLSLPLGRNLSSGNA